VSQHFLLSLAAKTLSLAQVFRMSDAEAEAMFCKVRWFDTNGKPVCPHCGGLDAYEARRPNGLLRFRCRACKSDFTVASGTLFASHKLPLKGYLAAIAIFCNEVKGKSMLALSRDLGTSYKTAFVLAHKLREAMAVELKGRVIGGEGKVAEVDGGYFGGYVKPAKFEMRRINHEEAYSLNGACTNWAETFFSRMRRAEIGHHHHVAGPYLLRFAQEASWREDNRRLSNGEQVNRVAGLAMAAKQSVDFCGYWQRHIRAG